MKFWLILFALLLPSSALADTVAASIKPLHSLVAAVMQGDGNELVLLVDGKQSMHSYTLKPSQRKAVEHAKVVFYIDDNLETFLSKLFATLPKTVKRSSMFDIPELQLYALRDGKAFDKNEKEDGDKEAVGKKTYDLHLWLTPDNAKAMIREIARQLVIAFPDKKELYLTNARLLSNKVNIMDRDFETRSGFFRERPFIVFHDAYQYFEKRYRLNAKNSLTLHPERGINAKHLSEVREQIKNSKAVCVFSEPQFDSRVVNNLVANTGVKSGVLDPEGALLEPGPELYFQLMEGLMKEMETCLQLH